MQQAIELVQKIWEIITSYEVRISEYFLAAWVLYLVFKEWRANTMSSRSLSLLAICVSLVAINTADLLQLTGIVNLPWILDVEIDSPETDIVRLPHPGDKKIDRTVVFMSITTNRRLNNAIPLLKSIYPVGVGATSQPIQERGSAQTMTLGWFNGTKQFERRPISRSDRFVIFNIFNSDHRLSLFTDTNAAEKTDFYMNIPPGDYVIDVQVDDETLRNGSSQKFKIHWKGKEGADSFDIKKCDDC